MLWINNNTSYKDAFGNIATGVKVIDGVKYFFDGDSDRAYWGYGTDNQTTVEARFGNPLSFLIGASSRWLNDYADKESGYGEAYFRNEEMKTDFEIVIHDNTV